MVQINWCLERILSKYVFILWSTKFTCYFGKLVLVFKFYHADFYKEKQIIQPRCNKVEIRWYFSTVKLIVLCLEYMHLENLVACSSD